MVPQVLFRDGEPHKASMMIFHNNHMISLYHWLSRIPGFIGFIGELDLPSSAAVMLKLILFAGLSAQPPFVSDLRFAVVSCWAHSISPSLVSTVFGTLVLIFKPVSCKSEVNLPWISIRTMFFDPLQDSLLSVGQM